MSRRKVALALAGPAAAVGGAGAVLYQIVKQQGRMLLRIDELERTLATAMGASANVPVGPPVGSTLDAFTATDLDGRVVSLADLAGRKALLVNWSATCGYCEMVAPELAGLAPDLARANTALVLLSRGDAEANRAAAEPHGLATTVLLIGDDANPAGFQGLGTPAALLVDEEGKVVSPLAVGADKVPALAREAAAAAPAAGKGRTKRLRGQRELSESRLTRDGLTPGTPAPAFSLPDLHGNPVSLDDFRGRRVLLAFSDPACGPCDQVAPYLVKAHEAHRDNNLAVILVGRGEVEENRRKAEEHGFEFPVVVQDRWSLSKDYGIFAAPVAFLIDERGTIARPVAKGVDEIVALVSGT